MLRHFRLPETPIHARRTLSRIAVEPIRVAGHCCHPQGRGNEIGLSIRFQLIEWAVGLHCRALDEG
jgi:hypothetical protein